MFIGLFRYVDDWLIDTIFQPFCNWLRDVFDWSKRVPVAITEAGIGHVLWLISIIFSASGNIFFYLDGRDCFSDPPSLLDSLPRASGTGSNPGST